MMNDPNCLVRVKEIKVNCIFESKKHFNASNRKRKLNNYLSFYTIFSSVLAGSAFWYQLNNSIECLGLISVLIAFSSAISTIINACFRFERASIINSSVGNKFIALREDCSNLIAKFYDNEISSSKICEVVENLKDQYTKLLNDSNCIETSKVDYRNAQKGVRMGEVNY